MDFIRTGAILAVGDHPYRTEPLIQSQRTVFEDGSAFGRKLLTHVAAFAFPYPARCDKARIRSPAFGTTNTIWPAQLDHCGKCHFRIGIMFDGFHEGFRFGVHETNLTCIRLLCQVY